MRGANGFTLLELMMVVIIIGVLASLAAPQYLKTKEKSRMAEALSVLGQMRLSEIRYFAERDVFTATLTQLDFNPMIAAEMAGPRMYSYSVSGITPAYFVAVATRIGIASAPLPLAGVCGVPGYTVRIDYDGTVCGTDCANAAVTCP